MILKGTFTNCSQSIQKTASLANLQRMPPQCCLVFPGFILCICNKIIYYIWNVRSECVSCFASGIYLYEQNFSECHSEHVLFRLALHCKRLGLLTSGERSSAAYFVLLKTCPALQAQSKQDGFLRYLKQIIHSHQCMDPIYIYIYTIYIQYIYIYNIYIYTIYIIIYNIYNYIQYIYIYIYIQYIYIYTIYNIYIYIYTYIYTIYIYIYIQYIYIQYTIYIYIYNVYIYNIYIYIYNIYIYIQYIYIYIHTIYTYILYNIYVHILYYIYIRMHMYAHVFLKKTKFPCKIWLVVSCFFPHLTWDEVDF